MELKEKVMAVIEKVRPALQGDGGDIELVDVQAEEKVVLVRLKGACFGCPMSTYTIKGYVEQVMKRRSRRSPKSAWSNKWPFRVGARFPLVLRAARFDPFDLSPALSCFSVSPAAGLAVRRKKRSCASPASIFPRPSIPVYATSETAQAVMNKIYQSLFCFDRQGKIRPELVAAVSPRTPSGWRSLLTLKKGARFADGSALGQPGCRGHGGAAEKPALRISLPVRSGFPGEDRSHSAR